MTEIPGGGGRRRLYLTLHCHHQNDSSVKMGSDESHFCVSLLIVRDSCTESVSCTDPNSKHWFTTSFLWRKVPESDARSVEEGAGKRCSECGTDHDC